MADSVDLIAKDLAHRAQAMAAASRMEARDADHSQIDEQVRLMLHSGSELMFSCASLAHGPHEQAINVLARSIIEMVIKVHWATLSQNNALLIQATAKEQLKTIFKVNAARGIARITDASGNDHTAALLASGGADKGPKAPSIETMATQCGLTDLYNVFYRFQSMHTHSNAVTDTTASTSAQTLGYVGVFSILLGHLGVRWLLQRDRPNNEEIRNILGLDSRVQP